MNKLQLIDADTLYYKPLAHPQMLIDGVLSDGLAILAGDSKIGKSWMVLWLCLQISRARRCGGCPPEKPMWYNPKLKALLACELDAWVENDPYLSPREKQVLRNQQPSQEDKTIIR